jgi:hypothetical protein
MHKGLLFRRRKLVISGLVAGLVIAAGGAAFAYFTSTGTGAGAAQTGTAASLTISQVGAGYDSLIAGSGDPYPADTCLGCVGITAVGDNVTLAGSAQWQQLVNVIVAVRNWNAGAITNLPITLTIDNGVAGPFTYTENTDSIPGATVAGSEPSLTDVTIDVSSLGEFVENHFTYGISYPDSTGAWGDSSGLNVALASSANDLSVGVDTNPGQININPVDNGSDWLTDAPNCYGPGGTPESGDTDADLTPGTLAPVTTDCAAAVEAGTFGLPTQVAAGNGDIPAVEINVVGGVSATLTPGGPAAPVSYAITNPSSASIHVNQVITALGAITVDPAVQNGANEACMADMYQVNNGTATINGSVGPGTTLFLATGTTVQMNDDGNNQDNCENATVGLTFSSN